MGLDSWLGNREWGEERSGGGWGREVGEEPVFYGGRDFVFAAVLDEGVAGAGDGVGGDAVMGGGILQVLDVVEFCQVGMGVLRGDEEEGEGGAVELAAVFDEGEVGVGG